ncbi:hypothetical protein [Kiloniella sp. GXU_MW_B19]|uniref:hypothetical protein n=1 Tax=Kiloniella sp. GXU_MW_B19 TaxID=3141326 RepID=UPI003F9EC676
MRRVLVLFGLAGNDLLIGGDGGDILLGGLGADPFILKDFASRSHAILNYSDAEGDVIQLSDLITLTITAMIFSEISSL